VGVKSSLLDRRLLLNVTGFWSTFENFQAQTFNSALAAFVLDNAGKLRSRGIEAEAIIVPVKRLNLSANVAYTDAEIREYIGNCYPGQTTALGCVGTGGQARQDLAGKRLNNAPEWAFSLSGAYSAPITDALNGFANVTYSYRSAVNFSIIQDPNTTQEGYGIVNASVGIETADRRLRLSAFAKNLLDKNFATFVFATPLDGGAAGSGYSQILTEGAQRIAGVALDFRF
jgi:iron complex outermembrane receptor protein